MLIIHDAKIYTLNPIMPFATALVIDHGEIVAVGMDDEILSSFATAELFDASGHAIIPGLTDAHIHLEDYALSLQKIDCETPTRQECLQRVAERAEITPQGEWILGHGWNQNNWAEGYGSAALLDAITPHHPVYLTHKSLHSAWANSSALRLAGISINTPDPAGGHISRLQSGEPDGILLESATDLLEKAIPEPGFEKVVNALQTTIPLLWRMGLTGIHDFSRSRCFSALQILHQIHALRLRVVKGIPLENLSQAVELGLRTGFGDDILRIGAVKLFSDGALGPHTAAMLQPYEDEPGNLGILMMDAEELCEFGRIAVKNGISMAIHAIGDRANHEVLNAYTQLREFEHSLPVLSQDQLRHRIEHVQVIQPGDAGRFSELGIIASMQPIHATSDMLMADRCWGSRSAYAYAWRSQLSHGATLAFGSDAPVESPNPFWGVHAAVTRRRQDGSPSPEGWYAEQRLSVDQALHAFTTGPAYAAGMEDRLGLLATGYLADLLILNNDPFTCLPGELVNIEPLATMVAGKWVYSAGI
ncbi:MAG: amidohydrolase [Anaerolineales bacterium]